MRVSFDIDDTLICYQPGVACEPNRGPWWLRRWFYEPLRLGTVQLMQELSRLDCSLWIYTTSSRSERYLRRLFGFYGISIAAVVNQQTHDSVVLRGSSVRRPSKLPRAFNIDLHVDDSEGVGLEGREYGFDVVVVDLKDTEWTSRVLEAVRRKMA